MSEVPLHPFIEPAGWHTRPKAPPQGPSHGGPILFCPRYEAGLSSNFSGDTGDTTPCRMTRVTLHTTSLNSSKWDVMTPAIVYETCLL